MNTASLIEDLTKGLQPVPRHAARRRLIVGLIAGGAITVLLVDSALGFRSDLASAIHGATFWVKWAYTGSLGLAAVKATLRLARPEPVGLRVFRPVLVPFAVLAIVALAELAHAPSGDRMSLWLGQTWTKCPWLVFVLSLPIFVGLLWSFRRMAPTRLRSAGAAAGLAAGAWAATIYGLHCPEASALFVLTWYTLGIALAAGAGALIGPRLLRW